MIAKTAAGGAKLLPEVLAFTSSLALDRALVLEDVVGSIAHVKMLGETKIIEAESARALVEGLATIADEARAGTLALPDEEDVHMAIEALLQARLGAPASVMHSARSRNDQVALTLRLHVRERSVELASSLGALVGELASRAEADAAIAMPGYTHRQRAQPISAAYWWLAYASSFARDLDAFQGVLRVVDEMPLGVGAIAGTSLPIDRERVRAWLGFERVTDNGLDTVGDRDFALDYAYASARFLVHASRLAADVVDLASAEFGFLRLDGAIACGSSMMPQKKNPDVFELVRGKSGRAIGDLTSLLVTVKGLPAGYARDLQEDRAPILDVGARTRAVIDALSLAIPRVAFDADRCLAALDDDATQSTDLAEALVERGLPFRAAYHAVGALVRLCKDEKTPLAKVTLAQAKRVDAAFDERVLEAARVRGSIVRKTSPGGSGPSSIRAQLATIRARVAENARVLGATPRLSTLLETLRATP